MTDLNFQAILRSVYDQTNNQLRTTGGAAGSSTIFVGTPTLHAVVNTSAAGDSTNNIGFATVSVSNPTLYAIVNTSAPGVGNSIVTIANTPLDTKIIGNVTLSGSVPTGENWIGLMTVHTANAQTNTGNVTINPGPNQIGSVTVANKDRNIIGNVTLSDSKTYVGLTTSTLGRGHEYIGLATVQQVGLVTVVQSSSARSVTGNLTLSDSKGFIGLVSVSGFANPLPVTFSGNVTLDVGSKTQIVGNVTLSDSKTYIGLTTSTIGSAPTLFAVVNTGAEANSTSTVFIGTPTLYAVVNTGAAGDSTANIGFATVNIANPVGNATLNPSPNFIGIVTIANKDRNIIGNITLSDPKTYVGLVTATPGRGHQFIGLVTVVQSSNLRSIAGNLTLSNSGGFIGLVTANSLNAGTTKTLVQLPVGLGNNSLSTVVVPTNNQKIKSTQIILNSNVTTEIAIKSGVTYLTGNASLGVTLFPGGGFVMNGSPDSPVWISLPSGAMVVEKRDTGGTVSKVAGHVIYFDEQ